MKEDQDLTASPAGSPPVWTHFTPTMDGYYWTRNLAAGSSEEIVQIIGGRSFKIRIWSDANFPHEINRADREWAGPIPQPAQRGETVSTLPPALEEMDALEDAADAYCSIHCASVKKVGEEWQHTETCRKIRIALDTVEIPDAKGKKPAAVQRLELNFDTNEIRQIRTYYRRTPPSPSPSPGLSKGMDP